MQKLKKVTPISVAKLYAVISAIFGLLDGLAIALLGTAVREFAQGYEMFGEVSFLSQFGVLAVIIVPIVYAIIGFIVAFIGAWIYNLIARFIGPIEVEFA